MVEDIYQAFDRLCLWVRVIDIGEDAYVREILLGGVVCCTASRSSLWVYRPGGCAIGMMLIPTIDHIKRQSMSKEIIEGLTMPKQEPEDLWLFGYGYVICT